MNGKDLPISIDGAEYNQSSAILFEFTAPNSIIERKPFGEQVVVTESGNKSLTKVGKELLKDIFKDEQYPPIKFNFTAPLSLKTNDDLAKEQVRKDIVKEGAAKEVHWTGKQFVLKLRTDIFKEGVASFSSLDTQDSHILSSDANGNAFSTNSAISSTPSYGMGDFNNSRWEDQLILEDGDLRRKLRKRRLENDEREKVNLD